MCHWKKWIWPGILTALVLSALALWMKTDIIQDDLTAKAESALSAGGHSWTSVDMEGRDATILGDAPSEAAQIEAAALTDGAYEVRVVDNQTDLLAAQSPYILNAKRDGDAIELTGFIPNEEMRGAIVASAKEAFPDAKITETMTLARGAPAGLAAIAGFGFSQLSGLMKGEMGLSDSKLSLKGSAKTRDTYNAVNAALDGTLPGGATLAMSAITAPTVSPYTWGANYDGAKLTLSGYVPSQDAAKSVVAAAKASLPSAEIINNQLVAPGTPKGFDGATSYALQQLSRFSSGKVELSDLNLSVSGVAGSSGKYTAALGGIGAAALPAGIALAKTNIVPATVSPYTWGAKYDGKTVILSGFVPDNKARVTIVAGTKKELPNATVVDQMLIAAGAPVGFQDAIGALIAGANRLDNSSGRITGINAYIQGRASSESEAMRIGNEIGASLPKNFKYRKQISYPLPKPVPVPEPPAPVVTLMKEFVPPAPAPVYKVCLVDFPALFYGEKVIFDADRAVIKEASFPLLNRIATGLNECKDSKIEVGGHTDNRGSEDYNQRLSEARALSVIHYMLTRAEVTSTSLVAKGYGELQPIAPNTVAERSKNRRIEFKSLSR